MLYQLFEPGLKPVEKVYQLNTTEHENLKKPNQTETADSNKTRF